MRFLLDHLGASILADGAHIHIRRADFAAQSAQRAGVDELVRIARAHHDREIVIHLADILLGVALVVLEIFTNLHTFHALALDAARSFFFSQLHGCNGWISPWQWRRLGRDFGGIGI